MESGSGADLAFGEYVSVALLDDAVDGGEAEAGAFSLFLGGKEGLKDAGFGFLVHAVAGIGNRDHGVASRLDKTVLAEALVHGDVGALQSEPAAFGHGILGVDHQVHDDLFELASVGAGVSGIGGKARDQLDVFADERPQEAL